MINLMNEYLKIIKQNMNRYMKYLVENKYIKTINDEFINVYIDYRYEYIEDLSRGNTIKNKISSELEKIKNELCYTYNEKVKYVETMYNFFDSCMIFNENDEEKIEKELEHILILRKNNGFITSDEEEYISILRNMIIEVENEKKELLKKTSTRKFSIRCRTTNKYNVKKVELKHNIKISPIYSSFAIEKAFNMGMVLEDKLFVEYYLVATQIINDIINCKYNNSYLVEFTGELLEKKQKLQRLMDIIDDGAIQDRMIITISNKLFINNKEAIYELFKLGYKFALKIDESFEESKPELQRLAIFSYIIVYKKDLSMIQQYDFENVIELAE